VSHFSRNPQRFAIEEMNETFTRAGRFTYLSCRDDLARLRLRLGESDGVRLVSWLRDLDGDVSSLFVDDATGATIYLREWRCAEGEECEEAHGALDVAAPTHRALSAAVALVERLGSRSDLP
jgi:hypothetical protein